MEEEVVAGGQSGFYIIDAFSLRQASKKPFHLEKRFLRMRTSSLEEAETKRAAILEARRQKLSRKFLAVQQVVKNVQARKEAQRVLFWQSLRVAELNRNNHIEQRRAASKELVERAKIIARQNMLRFEAEQERLRHALQVRLEQTHARRLHMLTQPKSRILVTGPDGVSKPMNRKTPTEKKPLEKKNKKNCLVTAFRNLGLPCASAPETWPSFGQLVAILRNKRVIQITTRILNAALNLTDSGSRKRARVLLSAYMMLTCPHEVFQDMKGAEEQQLLAAAKSVLHQFEKWLDSHDDPATRLAFEECWNSYYALFETWKSKDQKQLVANMSAYYLELVRLKHTLADAEPGLDEQLEQQLAQVKERLRGVGGSVALEHLAEAENAMLSSSQIEELRAATPSPTPREAPQQQQQQQQQMSREQLARLLGGYAPVSGISNEQVAHEIIIDPDFKLQKHTPHTELERRVKTIATQAFFDHVAEDIRKTLPVLMADVRQRLLSLIPNESRLHKQVEEAIDIALIEQQVKEDVFDFEKMLRYIVDIMQQICAPARDEGIAAIRRIGDRVQRLRAIMEMLDEMALDLANYRLSALRPYLIPIAVEYERSKFADALRNNAVGLANTRKWLKRTIRRLTDAASQRNPENVQPEKRNKPRPDAVFEEAFVSLLVDPEPISRATCPETLLLDVDRMAAYQNEVQACTMVAALVMLAKNFGHRGDLRAFADRLFVMLEDGATTIDHLAVEIERAVREERRPMVRAMVDKTLHHSDTVYSLLSRRVGSVIRTQVQTGQFATPEILASYGLEHIRKPLQQLCKRVMLLARHHRQVYAPWYDEIIADELEEA